MECILCRCFGLTSFTVKILAPPKLIDIFKTLDLKNEKDLATLALFDLLLDNEIAPDQLGQCVGCGKYFFKESRHRQIYCSHSCGHTTRSRERNKKKD